MKTKLLSLLACVALLLTSGCINPTYKAVATATVTEDQAADGWADYYYWATHQPGADPASLKAQDDKVAKLESDFASAADAVYFTRRAVAAGTATPDQLKATTDAASKAASALVNFVLSNLPQDRAAKLKATP